MIILNNTVYNIHIIKISYLVITALFLLIPIIWFLITPILTKSMKQQQEKHKIINIITIIMILLFLIGIVVSIMLTIQYINSPRDEVILYNAMKMERVLLQDVIDANEGEIEQHIYEQALNFNRQLIINNEYVTNSYYAPMRWSMNWKAIPEIVLPTQIKVVVNK